MLNRLTFLLLILFTGLILVIQSGCNAGENEKDKRSIAVNPNANEDVNKVLKYLISLPERAENT